jgi:enamine deaminase RidA (YjgF/YER057c/UK114 family)
MSDVLERLGCGLADVATQTVVFVGDQEAAAVAAGSVHPEVFGSPLPASAMVGVDRLVDPRFLVEVQVTAYESS